MWKSGNPPVNDPANYFVECNIVAKTIKSEQVGVFRMVQRDSEPFFDYSRAIGKEK